MSATIAKYPVVWELDSLLPHPETDDFRKRLEAFKNDLNSLANRSDKLPAVSADKSSTSAWVELLADYERLAGEYTELGAHLECHVAADAENKLFQRIEAQLAALAPLREKVATNIEFALKDASEAQLDSFIAADDRLRRIAFFLHDRRKNAALRLPKEQELLAAELGVDGIHAWGRFYDRVSGALRIRVMERGEIVEKSPGQVHFNSPQRAVRENNFFAASKAWHTVADTCAEALNHLSGTRLTIYRRLGVRDHLDAPLRYNRLRRETLEAMWSAVSSRRAMLAKYLERKAALLGVSRPAWYDLGAPLPLAKSTTELPYDEACDIVIDAFTQFTPELGDFARRTIVERWIEVEDRPGKKQGGFCTGFPVKKQTRIFMTYTNTPDSMSTLAHELGHAYHSHVLRDEPLFLRDYPMNLAETASTFAEAVLGQRRIDRAGTSDERLAILDEMLGDAVSYLMNIHARFIFEDNFHRERATGEISAERISEIMLAAQKEAYLNSLSDDGWYPGFWISKLHFYISALPFYNFPYTFGYLLSLGVYATAGEFGDEFPERYRKLLIATGCKETEEAVSSTLGYDLTKGDFWNRSLDVVEQRVEQFLKLSQ